MQSQLSRGGYHVYTTIDKQIYEAARAIADEPKNFSPDDPTKGIEQIGAVMMESKTGAILAMIEGRDFTKGQLNHATQAFRLTRVYDEAGRRVHTCYGKGLDSARIRHR